MSGPAGSLSSAQLSLKLLGGFTAVRDDGVDIPRRWRRSTAQSLVKLLAVAPGLRRHREEVMELLWPGVPMEAAVRNLRVTLHAARHALEPELAPRNPSSYLLTEGDLLLLSADRVRVDVDEAEEAARSALSSGDVQALDTVLAALGHELLPEDRYADWAGERRRRLDVLRERLVKALAERLLADDRTDEAVAVLRVAVDRTPTDEALHLLLARTWCAMGRPRQAIRQYHACREALADELGTRPGPEVESVHRAALAALDALGTASVARPATNSVPLPAAIRRPERLPLFGRERPLDLLVRHATSGPDETPLVVVRGEAGIGKTRLVAEAARRAAAEGVRVLWGTGHEAEGQTPYGVFADALDGHLAQYGADERSRLSAEHVGLAALVPSLGAAPPAAASPEEERARLFRAVDGVLTDLAADRPVLVVLDDLHAADPGSLGLLHHLVRTGQARRRRFIATYRDEMLAADDARRQVLDGIVRQRMAVDVDLLRLSRTDCAGLATAASHLAGQDTDRRTASRLFRLSLGNPLFALELATSPDGDLERLAPAHPTPAEPGADAVPDSIRRLVRGRLARLPEDTRRALSALSVAVGAAVSLAEVESVAADGLHPPLTGPEVTTALDAALDAGVIEERDVVLGGRSALGYAFRHPLVRLACAEQLSRASRRRIHQTYADVLLRLRPDAVDALAHHMSVAQDPRAPLQLRAAADRAAALYANDSACVYYQELVARLDATDPSAAPEARLAWGRVLWRAARYAEAEDVLRRAYDDLMAAADHVGALQVAVSLAEALGRAGRPLDGLAVLAAAPESPRSAAVDRAHRELAVGALSFYAGRYDDTLAALDRAEGETADVASRDRVPLLARLFTSRAAAQLVSGRLLESREAAEEALRAAEKSDDATLLSSALSVVGELAREEGRLDAARDIARRAVSTARRTGDPTLLAFDQSNLAGAELLAGGQVRAAALADAAVRLARSLGSSWVLPYALVVLAEVELRCGRLPQAEAALGECAEAVALTRDPQVLDGMRRLSEELAAAWGHTDRQRFPRSAGPGQAPDEWWGT
ncbi:ATP-binding protein [Streptomyces poriferorum]|uniref:AAA family ATPase n=1 Tax=Streptomyces poriferorum TaxID=2798799 RepID=A0ABY9IZ66_9ACTN|nr:MULTISPECIES: AAA family ATPase [unclassified Streptomyces]MDP5310205.1 AAA family ATPase [Streptomyces sp. Alt4]WLQ60632.1 AAA family ATPase [Streptomyces sp. Alt2]